MNDRTRAWLELTRISNLPTVLSSAVVSIVFLGGNLMWGFQFAHLFVPTVAICLFYVAGFIFNDLFDRRIDAVERPDRPIPSGRVDPRAAMQVGAFFMIAGVLMIFMIERHGVAEMYRGIPAGTIAAALLVLLILAYDRFHARSSWWVFGMGGCRAMVYLVCLLTVQTAVFTPVSAGVNPANILTVYMGWPDIILFSPFPFILTMFLYISAFSRIARGEVAPDGEGSHYCDACGYLVADTTRRQCSECGHELDPETLERTTTPPMRRWLRTLCLAGTLLPVLYLFGLSLYRFGISLYYALFESLNSPGEFWIMMSLEMALGLGVLGWMIFAASRYVRGPCQPKRSIQMWIAGIPLIEALFIFMFRGSVTGMVVCLICWFITIRGHRKVSGT